MGADGVQMGTRFLATEESSTTVKYKQAVVDAREDDIIVAHDPALPCGMPSKLPKQSPMYVSTLHKLKAKSDKGYVLYRTKANSVSALQKSNEHPFLHMQRSAEFSRLTMGTRKSLSILWVRMRTGLTRFYR